IADLNYQHLLVFVADFEAPSVHVKKNRVWALHHFYHFLKLNHIIDENIAAYIPYPKIGRKVPQYLTITEFNQLLEHFASRAVSPHGLRNLNVIMLFGLLGLRLRSVLKLDIADVDLSAALIRIREKGNVQRLLPLPGILCRTLTRYLQTLEHPRGPLFLSKRGKRLSERTVQDFLRTAMAKLDIDKHLHAHLFRHTAATYLNKVAGPDVTQHVLGHAARRNTVQYSHLNPDVYAVYMKKHPYMNL
ncbi:MAG: tyrosine-type recombinase/integrase, partial [Nitrosomonadaceae bacterium]